MLSFLLYQFVLYCNDNLSLLFVYYLNKLMDSHVIQWIISHHYHIYFDACIVPDLATGSFWKRMTLRANLTCFAGVKNEIWGSVERGFPHVFLCEGTGDWGELGKTKPCQRQGQGLVIGMIWRDRTLSLESHFFHTSNLGFK